MKLREKSHSWPYSKQKFSTRMSTFLRPSSSDRVPRTSLFPACCPAWIKRFCARKVLSELGGFNDVLSRVGKILHEHGQECIFFPKYRPELDAIDRFGKYVKYLIRHYCVLNGPPTEVIVEHVEQCTGKFIVHGFRVPGRTSKHATTGVEDCLQCEETRSRRFLH